MWRYLPNNFEAGFVVSALPVSYANYDQILAKDSLYFLLFPSNQRRTLQLEGRHRNNQVTPMQVYMEREILSCETVQYPHCVFLSLLFPFLPTSNHKSTQFCTETSY